MRDLIATKTMRYGAKKLQAGESFLAATRQDARVLVALGKARYAVPAAPEQQPGQVPEALGAAEPVGIEAATGPSAQSVAVRRGRSRKTA